MPRPLLLGHRGARASASIAENTFRSFDLALQHGCDGFEFDMRRTVDARPVICHDPRHHGVEIALVKGESLPDLPVLEDLLVRYQRRAFLDIELKVPGLESSTLGVLQRYLPERGFVVSSFLPQVVREVAILDARIPLGIICDTREQLARWHHLPITHVMPHHKLVSRDLVEEAHAANKKVFVWTINRAEDMVRFADWGADAIISDDTELLVRTLGKTS
ncbi:MAG TPA: glycerophosphodiester phosphodiesterase [Terriglobales bacterium]|nr:glycerophosphodiester phosphodiesterase [Terriglobales bacterium]